MLFGFVLGREFKLSISEIHNVFYGNKIIYCSKEILILEEENDEKIIENTKKIGGTIKIIELEKLEKIEDFLKKIIENAKKNNSKFNYSINIFPKNNSLLKKLLTNSKKTLKQNEISSRFANKTNENLSSAQIIGNNLLKKGGDFNLIKTKENIYFGKTIWIQDINAYSSRDYGKNRDMQIGMLPPKLSQIMINLSKKNSEKINSIYDPFVGLATILIEGVYMGIKKLYASDYNSLMVETSKKNLLNLKKNFDFDFEVIEFDARDMQKNIFIEKYKNINIITEGFLGEIMTKKNISIDRINIQRKNLKKLYEKFFSGLYKQNFSGNIVISFPFWELEKKYIFFEEIYEIIKKYCEIIDLLPKNIEFETTKTGSLLYKRPSQLVGREIFKLKIKK